MRSAFRLIGAGLVGLSLAGCDGGTGNRPDGALVARLDALEKRVATAEQSGEAVERLRNEVAGLDRRLSSLETSVRELSARPPAGAPGAAPGAAPVPPAAATQPPATRPAPSAGPAAWNNPTTRLDRTQRRTELRALSDEFRSRLAQLRTQPDGNDPEKAREILDWYRDQRRAILRGDGRTDE